MAEVIKIEDGLEHPNICHGCLSQDRNVSIPPGEVSQAFCFLITPQTHMNPLTTKLCWECVALLKRFSKFRKQLLRAQCTLIQMYYLNTDIQSLSSLSTTTKLDYDQKFKHINSIGDEGSFTINTGRKLADSVVKKLPKLKDAINPIAKDTADLSIKEIPIDPLVKDLIDPRVKDATVRDAMDSIVKDPIDTTVKIEVKREPINLVLIDEGQMDDINNDVDDFDHTGFDYEADNIDFKEENPSKEKVVNKKKKNKNIPHNFIEHAIVKANDKDWSKEKDTSEYFTDEYLDENQVEEYVLKLERLSKPRWLIKCKTCKKEYPNKPDYLRHLNLNHREPNASNNCLLCRNKFPSLEQLQHHWKHAHSCYSRCNMCHMYCKRRAQKKHLNYYHTKLYCCDECGEQLVTPKLFNVHYKEKHATFICQLCQRIFHYKRTLIKHMEASHRSLNCKYCNKEFKKAPYLARHMIAFHADALNIPRDNESAYCVECDRNFISITRLKEHLKYSVKHAPPRPPKSIPCPECGKIFSRLNYMNNHYNCAHTKDGAKHVCSYCGKFYVTSGSLKRHYDEVHLKLPKPKDKICDLCGEGFSEKRMLVRHCRRTHAYVVE